MSPTTRSRPAGLVREPAVAGSFYPGSHDALAALVQTLLAAADRLPAARDAEPGGIPTGLLVPHAGLVYSGITAAAGWGRLAAAGRGPAPTVVILGTNHGAGWLDGIASWPSGSWRTPLGEIPVDDGLATAVVQLGDPFLPDADAHDGEHSIEVQLPLLATVAPGARIVPLSVSCGRGARAVEAGRRLGQLLAERRARGDAVVLALSSDMAHYPAADASERVTATLLPPILAVDAPALADRETAVRLGGTRGLACGMCGIEPAVVGLAALRAMGATHATRLAASTSADAGGSPDRTVGYLAVRFDE